MIKYIYNISIFLLLFFHFPVYSQNVPAKINILPNQPNSSLMLSDLIEDIEYIPLETNQKCLLGDVRFFDISANYIVVYCVSPSKAFLFHRNGRFIAQLGDIGQGPKEYLTVHDVLIDEKNNQVIVHAGTRPGSKFLIYD